MTDLIGKTFGDWTVLEKDIDKSKEKKVSYYKCKCSCGVERSVNGNSLLRGKSQSCGHVLKEKNLQKALEERRKLVGKVFGEWTVIGICDDATRVKCKCSCGTVKKVLYLKLLNGKSTSCGCKRAEENRKYSKLLDDYRKESIEKYVADGTDITAYSQKLSKNSTTGVKGVARTKSGKYRAYINVQRKQIYIGTYDYLEDAKVGREIAEKEIFGKIKENWEDIKSGKTKIKDILDI